MSEKSYERHLEKRGCVFVLTGLFSSLIGAISKAIGVSSKTKDETGGVMVTNCTSGFIPDAFVATSLFMVVFRQQVNESLLSLDNSFYSVISSFIKTHIINFFGLWHILLTLTLLAVALDFIVDIFMSASANETLKAIMFYKKENNKAGLAVLKHGFSIYLVYANALLILFWLIVVAFLPKDSIYFAYNSFFLFPYLSTIVISYYMVRASRIGRLEVFYSLASMDSKMSGILSFIILIFSGVLGVGIVYAIMEVCIVTLIVALSVSFALVVGINLAVEKIRRFFEL